MAGSADSLSRTLITMDVCSARVVRALSVDDGAVPFAARQCGRPAHRTAGAGGRHAGLRMLGLVAFQALDCCR